MPARRRLDRRRAAAGAARGSSQTRRSSRRSSPRRRRVPRSAWTRDDALVELLRGRLTIARADHAGELAAPLGDRGSATSTRRCSRSKPKAWCCADVQLRRPAGAAERLEWCDRAPARAHPSLHAQPPARRDRAGQPRRFHAVPVRLAARRRRRAAHRHRRPARRRSQRSTASSWPPAPGSARSCRRASTATTRRCSTCCASPARSAGRGSSRRAAPARHRCGATPVALFLREHAPAVEALRDADADARRAPLERRRARGARRAARARRVVRARARRDLRARRDASCARRSASWSSAGLVASDGFAGLARADRRDGARADADARADRRRPLDALGSAPSARTPSALRRRRGRRDCRRARCSAATASSSAGC